MSSIKRILTVFIVKKKSCRVQVSRLSAVFTDYLHCRRYLLPLSGVNGKAFSHIQHMVNRKYLTRSEVNKILQTIIHGRYVERDSCLFLMSFLHGLRVSEAACLRLSDIDLTGRCIFISRLKNSLSTQHPLFDEEIPLLKAWIAQRKHWRGASNNDWLFLSQKGGRLSRQQIRQLLLKYGALCGIRASPHMLRHACGFALADLGKDTRLIQDYLGHKNIRHTVLYTVTNAGRFASVWDGLC